MKLYYAPGACSQAPHIALRETGAEITLVKVDLAAKKTEDGADYRAINSKGAVPALKLADGSVLTENAAILQYIADEHSGGELIPLSGIRRYRLLEWLNYIATELHKGFGPLWNPSTPEEQKESTRKLIGTKFDFVQQGMGEGPFLTGPEFTIADAYLFVILNWTRIHGIDLQRWPGLAGFVARVGERPSVKAALKAEGLAG
ncbi:MAG TPA: glutathione transferase GstA [Allosphingosinicella sp.]|jgi:glutathione S-transferase|uniref:glutathione transferase GstA n=1 Tax=Allosphingosinicella sp. TaxID=2823234 RepID=UPI002F282629